METIIAQIFRAERKLTQQEFDSLKQFNIIDAGGISEEGYFYNFNTPNIEILLKIYQDLA